MRPMSRPITVVFVSAVLAGVGTASAQMYDPKYPVCMQVYGEELGDRMDCVFTSLAQCAASARGLPATCLMNPYYSDARRSPRQKAAK